MLLRPRQFLILPAAVLGTQRRAHTAAVRSHAILTSETLRAFDSSRETLSFLRPPPALGGAETFYALSHCRISSQASHYVRVFLLFLRILVLPSALHGRCGYCGLRLRELCYPVHIVFLAYYFYDCLTHSKDWSCLLIWEIVKMRSSGLLRN